ncbi:hypothetical protein G3T36_08290 [Diaminobutyricibacter tongyongensis]|uniref:Uncharacterized protein n=1 Tax=Leifsonia tongyongensis TaxID=1268043 RepID=A0A6L9XWQ7_9MICO|nr:hypothetical protein [Diaminobutyricibacter tongyongensis]NEN05871.1 hypothetical protein [Diaminobutyricibacter tongyongensis]
MDRITDSQNAPRRPDASELAEFTKKLREIGPGSGLYPGTIVSIDAGHLFHSLGTGANLALPSGVATGDVLFAPNLNPAFFYSWDVHPEQPPDWFRVSVRFTPADFGITQARSYELEWVVVPWIFELGAVLTLEVSTNSGTTAQSWTLEEFGVRRLRIAAGPIEPNETIRADLVRNSTNGSWIWLRTNIAYAPPVVHQ